ncbi:hypothetical protein X943_000660 [Babesia divergens]|uniref:Uncharacterized protein n=1 Tax=Babesia divergens TaxID=32595 RepID=A0AAD9GH56_BABDI|nr:hypothetical protein X943_000660 [Babesia divergens]
MSSKKCLSSQPPSEDTSSPLATAQDGALLLKVRVKPGAKFTQLVGEFEDPLGVQVAAPPREGACNEALVEFIGDILKLKRRDVSLISGHKSRDKVLSVRNIMLSSAEELLRKQLQLDA